MYTKIKDGLYLVSQDLPKNSEIKFAEIQETINRIVILDGSGSMYSDAEDVKRVVIDQAKKTPATDTMSVGVFSSKGQFTWVCKGANPSNVAKLMENYRFPFNMTCYSDILADTENLIKDLTPISSVFSLLFMSDGFPNQDTHNITDILKKLAPKISTSTLIGFGDYYGRDLMANMAKTLGGNLVHSSNFRDFSNHFETFRESKASSQPRIEFEVPTGAVAPLVSIGVDYSEIISHGLESKTLSLSPNTQYVAYLSTEVPSYDSREFGVDAFAQEVYALSRAALQAGNYNLAADLLAALGDVKFVDGVTNSFTVSEYGKVENELLEATVDETKQFVKGRKQNYLPKEDAFCMLDLADLFAADETAKFLPYHPAFSYKKIGRSSKQKDGFPKFNASKDVAVKLNTFVWNSKKLNLGVLANIKGTIDLDSEAPKVGLDQLFNTFIWRNYALISDGKLNVTKLPVKDLSPETLKVLRENEVIESENGVIVLDLTKVPVINRKIANDYTDLNAVCRLLKKENRLEVEQKTFKYLYSTLPEELQAQIDDLVKPTIFTDAQVVYLEKFGVKKDGSFAPETEKQDPTDFLMVKEFEFGIKGLNTIPRWADVESRISSGKSLSPVQNLVFDAYTEFSTETKNMSQQAKALWLKERILSVRQTLRIIRSNINRAKFAVVLGKTNFEQIPVLKEKNDYEYEGLVYEIKVKDIKVDI